MSDFPNPAVDPVILPTHISSWGDLMMGRMSLPVASQQGSSTAWSTANTAIYIPLWLPWPYPVARAFWNNGTGAGGNSDIGIYSVGGTRLWSAGSTAGSGNSAPQFVTVNMVLAAGPYYLAFTHSTVTASQVYGVVNAALSIDGRLAGVYGQASALPLPATATFATFASSATYPLIGITRTASGF